jgi:hypothetical protein
MAKMKTLSRIIRGLSILGNNEIKMRSIAASKANVCAGLHRESIIYLQRENIQGIVLEKFVNIIIILILYSCQHHLISMDLAHKHQSDHL